MSVSRRHSHRGFSLRITFSRRAGSLILCAVALVAGCDKSVGPFEVLPPLEPSNLDASAGSWRMIVLSSPSQIAVPAPASITSAAYLAELDAIKSSQSTLTSEQRQAIAYWSGGGVMRWNQIVRELVARYNLPPAPTDQEDIRFPTPTIRLVIQLSPSRTRCMPRAPTAT